MKLYPNINYIFIIWFMAVFFISLLGFNNIPLSGKFSNDFWQSLGNWDGGHYIGIAEAGYSERFQYAFFPLYPLSIKVLSLITSNTLLSAVLISAVSTYLGLHLLNRLIVKYFDKKIAEKAVFNFIFFPTSFFLLAAYSEGLFFFLVVLSFFCLQKKKLFWACLVAGLASATRLAGLAVAAGLTVEILSGGFNRKSLNLIFAPLGFVFYAVFLYQQTGDPFYFITAENHWQRTLTIPTVGFWQALTNITSFNMFLDLIFAIFGLGFTIRSFRFLPASWAFYSLLSVLPPLFTPTLSSIPRYLLPVFPIFILAALIKKPFVNLILQIFSIILLGIFTALFITGYFIS